jgi:hypothetical protein
MRQKYREATKRYFQEHPEARIKWSQMYSGKGKHLSVDHKNKISETQKKRPTHSQFSLGHHLSDGEKNPMFGRRGSKSPTWQGGKSLEPYDPNFNYHTKRRIFERDKYTCQNCGICKGLFIRKGDLVVHHIDSNKQNSQLKNLVTLCRGCHGRKHKENSAPARLIIER